MGVSAIHSSGKRAAIAAAGEGSVVCVGRLRAEPTLQAQTKLRPAAAATNASHGKVRLPVSSKASRIPCPHTRFAFISVWAAMGWPWALPFFGTLSSIALGPALFPKIWRRHHGKISAGWAALTIGSIAVAFGSPAALAVFVHAMLGDYLSFIVVLFALYTTAGGFEPMRNEAITLMWWSSSSFWFAMSAAR